jgi:serine/threonine protein kinase
VDAIVGGDRCVWVVDEKGFGGRLTGDEHTWILADGSVRARVLNNLLHAAKMVNGKLEAANPQLARLWVEGLILLTADDADARVEDQRITKHVRRLAGCENYFLRANIANARPLRQSDREAIERCLSGEGIVDRLRTRLTGIGPYRLIETLSSGPIVRTYRAERQRTNDLVELKVYDLSALPDAQTGQETRKRIEREFEALRKLRDTQGVVRVAESFQPVEGYGGELYYFALDLPAGPCLASRLSEALWSYESRFAAAKRLCEIVHAVHQAGVIHRNLSPACLYFWRTDTDFQLTGFEFSRLPTSTLHIPGEFPASPYTAPEIMDSPHNATKASDIFSLGVILFELLTGRRPFGNRTRTPEDEDPVLELPEDLLSPSKRDDLGALLQLMVAHTP